MLAKAMQKAKPLVTLTLVGSSERLQGAQGVSGPVPLLFNTSNTASLLEL